MAVFFGLLFLIFSSFMIGYHIGFHKGFDELEEIQRKVLGNKTDC